MCLQTYLVFYCLHLGLFFYNFKFWTHLFLVGFCLHYSCLAWVKSMSSQISFALYFCHLLLYHWFRINCDAIFWNWRFTEEEDSVRQYIDSIKTVFWTPNPYLVQIFPQNSKRDIFISKRFNSLVDEKLTLYYHVKQQHFNISLSASSYNVQLLQSLELWEAWGPGLMEI